MHITNTSKQAASDLSSSPTSTPAPSRRSLLAMAAAGIASVPSLAMAASGQAEPDVDLIKLCKRFSSLERRYIELLYLPEGGHKTEDQREALMAEQRPLIEAICQLRCTTPNGVRALAEAVVVANSEMVKRTGDDCDGERLCHTLLISLLGSPGIELEGEVISAVSPSAVFDEDRHRPGGSIQFREPDAELIQACRDLDAVTAHRRALYDYEPGSKTDDEAAAIEAADNLSTDDYAEARGRMVDLPCTTLKGLGAMAKSMLGTDVADVSIRVDDGDLEFVLIRKVLEQAATYA